MFYSYFLGLYSKQTFELHLKTLSKLLTPILTFNLKYISVPGKSTGGGRGSGICGDPEAAVSSKVIRLLSPSPPKLPPPPLPKKPKSLPPKPNPSSAGRRFEV